MTEHHCEARKEDDLCEIFQDTISTSMLVKEEITIFVILTCLIVISTQALPYSQRNRDGIGADSKRNFKDVSPGWGGVSQRKPNGSPSRSVPSHGSPRPAAHGLSAEQKNLGRRSSRRDVFTDFYEAKNDKAASYRHDDELDDDAEDGRCLQDDGNWSFDRDLMKNLIGILQTGKIGRNHEKMNKQRMVPGHNFMRTLSPVTRQGTFLEIGTGVTSLHLAASEKMQSLVTSLIIPEPDHKKLLQMSKSYNAFIGSVSAKDINSLLTSLVQDPEVFFGSILLSNLTALIGDNLPHEFEKLIGQVFLLAKETYLSAPSTDRYTASYMHSWSSVQNMAERACSSLDVTCAISAMAMDSWDLPTLTKVTLIEGQRPLTRQYCCGETMEDCTITYRTVNGTEDITVGASQHKEVRFQRIGLLLSTLLKLNLVESSLERLIVPLLEMDYNPERIARNILVTNKQFMIHSELPSCQSLIYENDKTQQGRDIANILSGAKEQSAEMIDEKMPLQSNRYAENINGNVVKDTSGIESRQNSVLQPQQSNDQNLIVNMHTMYANKAGENLNMHAMHANNGLNMHNEYADGNGVKDRLRSVEGSQKLTFQGNEERQSIDRVGRRSSAIKNNQRAFKGEEQKLDFADMNRNNVGLQKGLNLADKNTNDMGLQNGVNMMQRRPRNAVGWTGDEEGDQRKHDRSLEWERAREEFDRSQGVRQQALKSQVDMVADLWQRETEDASDAKRKPEVPGSNWDRETDSRSSHDPSASKLVAVGNLLLTRDEANPPVQEKSWEITKGERRQEGQTRKNKNDEGAAMQELDARGRRKVSEKQEGGNKLVPSRNGMEDRRSEETSNSLGGQQPLKPPPGVAGGGKDSKIASDDSPASANKVRDSSIKDNGLPVSDKGKASRGGRFPKQRRKQFRQASDSMQGGIREDDGKSTDKIRGSSIQQPLTPSERVTVRRATETGKEKRDDKSRAMDALPYQQRRQLLQYYDNDFAYNAEVKMRSDTMKEVKEDQQELDARRRMMESIARQQEQGGEPRWEELESNIEEMEEGDVGDDYYDDGGKIEDDVKEGAPNEDVEDYNLAKDDGPIPGIIPHEKDEDGWREDAFQRRHLGAEDDDSHGDAREDEDEEEEIGRMMKEMMKVKETEGEKIFDSMWQVLEGVFFDEETHEFSLMTYGGKELSLLSAKVSRSYPNSSILTIIPAKDDQLIGSHRKLQESLQLTNNIITQSELSDRIVFSLYQQMEYFRFQVLGLATFQKIVTYGTSFPSFLGHLLALSRTTFIQVPHPVTLASLQVLLHSSLKDKSGDSIYKGFLSASLEEAGVLDYSITVLNKVYLQNHAKLVRVDIHAFYRQVTMDCSGSLAYFKQDASKPVSLAPLRSAAAGDFPIQTMGGAIRLQSLLSLGLLPNERKLLFREYLKLAVHSDMCPMTILWQRGRLFYSPIIDSTIENPDQHIPCADDRRALVETMTKQLDIRPFSFMEYGTGRDGLSITLATKYPNSTFILVTGSEKGAETRQDDLNRKNVSNAVVTSMGADMSFASNLVSSPDFMRYQYIGVNQLFSMMIGYQQSMLQSMFGDIISSGVTTFFQMPSAQMLSLAVSTLYPEVLCDFKETEVKLDIFQASKHPLHGFKNYELKLMKENIQVQSGQANLSASVIHPLPNPDGSQLGWSMVRVDVRQLEIMVDHHFMYALDGHQRKYYLHCNSNATHYEVYLIRAHDGFKIPYQEVKGISLIALLRMGLLPQIKENFYNQFLKLPLYGDMAPWNILFSGGKLEYIDYDTKQMTLDKVAPAAYQIMAMLMNYKRTVEDFGHCNFNGRNPYGFDLVSHCVGSNYEGSCTDERFPVACADQSCRANYIECLRALSEIEQKHSGIKAVGSAESRSLSNTKQDEETLTTEIGERLELSFKGQSGTGRMDFYRKR